MAKITKTGELREFLCEAISNVASGDFDVNKAREITKIAAQINESLYAEVKVTKTQLEMGNQAVKFGNLNLGAEKKELNNG